MLDFNYKGFSLLTSAVELMSTQIRFHDEVTKRFKFLTITTFVFYYETKT